MVRFRYGPDHAPIEVKGEAPGKINVPARQGDGETLRAVHVVFFPPKHHIPEHAIHAVIGPHPKSRVEVQAPDNETFNVEVPAPVVAPGARYAVKTIHEYEPKAE